MSDTQQKAQQFASVEDVIAFLSVPDGPIGKALAQVPQDDVGGRLIIEFMHDVYAPFIYKLDTMRKHDPRPSHQDVAVAVAYAMSEMITSFCVSQAKGDPLRLAQIAGVVEEAVVGGTKLSVANYFSAWMLKGEKKEKADA